MAVHISFMMKNNILYCKYSTAIFYFIERHSIKPVFSNDVSIFPDIDPFAHPVSLTISLSANILTVLHLDHWPWDVFPVGIVLHFQQELYQTVTKFSFWMEYLVEKNPFLFLMQGLGHPWKMSCRAISRVGGQAVGKQDGKKLSQRNFEGKKFYPMSLQEFLENEQEILNAVTALLRKIQHREEKIGDINSRLRSSLEGLDSLLEKKSRMDDEGKICQNCSRFGLSGKAGVF